MFWYHLCKIWVIFVGVNVRYVVTVKLLNSYDMFSDLII